MNHQDAYTLVAAAWKTAWLAAGNPFTVEVQNQPFEQPVGEPWGRYNFMPAETEPAALGTPGMKVNRTPFALVLQVFLPEGKGTRAAYVAQSAVARLNYQTLRSLDGKTVVSLRCAGMVPGIAEDGFDAFNVTLNGTFDTYETA